MAAAIAIRKTYKEAMEVRPRRRIARGRKRSGFGKICSLVAAMALLLGYIGIYAQVTHTGYRRATLLSQLRSRRLENQALRVEIQNLSSPDRLSAAAMTAGMMPGTEMSFISSPKPISVASADGER